MTEESDHETRGLIYPPDFLSSLPILHPRPHPHTPLRALSARDFAKLHTEYLTSHARDHSPSHVLFPFLHGTEGDNGAQNAFFAQAQSQPTTAATSPQDKYGNVQTNGDGLQPFPAPKKPPPPKFRGLIWVSSDDLPFGDTLSDEDDIDELDSELDSLSEEDDYSSSESTDSLMDAPMDIDLDLNIHPPRSPPLTEEEDEEMQMQLDPTLNGPVVNGCPPLHISGDNKGKSLSIEHANGKSKPKKKHDGNGIIMTAGQLPTPPHRAPAPIKQRSKPRHKPAVLTSSFKPWELLKVSAGEEGREGGTRFVDLKVPGGISLRNFGIQVATYTTVSDIVVYSPRGATRSAAALAEKFKEAVEAKFEERVARLRAEAEAEGREEKTAEEWAETLVKYNVFVLDATPEEMASELEHMLMRVERRSGGGGGAHTEGTDATTHGEAGVGARAGANTVDFAMREKEEMRDLTRASEILSVFPDDEEGAEREVGEGRSEELSGRATSERWEPDVGQVFLGNSSDVPLPPDRRFRVRTQVNARKGDHNEEEEEEDAFDWTSNDPRAGHGYDICVECHDFAPFPTSAHLRAAEEHVKMLEKRWIERCVAETGDVDPDEMEEWKGKKIPVRPPPSASSVIHLPFPSSPASAVATLNALMPFVALVERLVQPVQTLTVGEAMEQLKPKPPPVQTKIEGQNGMRRASDATNSVGPRSLPPPNAFPASFFVGGQGGSAVGMGRVRSTSATFLPSSLSSTLSSSSSASSVSGSSSTPGSTAPSSTTTSPTLLSSPSSICASPTTSTNRRNSTSGGSQLPLRTRPVKILIYSADGYTESSVLALSILMALRHLSLPEAYLELQLEKRRSFFVYQSDVAVLRTIEGRCKRDRERERAMISVGMAPPTRREGGRAPALSVSFAPLARPLRAHSDGDAAAVLAGLRRPRANTLPVAERPAWGDHQAWFDDPRFDGSFPSRVLPFLYLGNLNHASNAYMLHALGITHVVSVGESALVKPQNVEGDEGPATNCGSQANGKARCVSQGPGGHGSLWVEEREGRIKVLDIKGVCDDGIDSIEPWLEPVCEWIDKAREEGGKVLVHCRVGVSRSATVVIAYVMKHLNLPLVDAYLIVRSRRLSVLIQPNVRLLYNLLGWEVMLAQQRAANDEKKLRNELARCLNWPYLAKQVHLLNEKYLH